MDIVLNLSFIQILEGFVMFGGIMGYIYIARLNPVGFYYWIASNFTGVYVFYEAEKYSFLILYLFFALASVYGLFNWKSKEKKTGECCPHCKK